MKLNHNEIMYLIIACDNKIVSYIKELEKENCKIMKDYYEYNIECYRDIIEKLRKEIEKR